MTIPPEYKIINGKKFKRMEYTSNKKDAYIMAKEWRTIYNVYARVIPYGKYYAIYYKQK